MAALYLHGGYYFDTDMVVIEPFILADDVAFSTALQPHGGEPHFFQSFLASAPLNPVLFHALELMQDALEGKIDMPPTLRGTLGLKMSFDSFREIERGKSVLLEEINGNRNEFRAMHPHLIMQEGRGCCCNFVVHNPETITVHFFSRFVGSGLRCESYQ